MTQSLEPVMSLRLRAYDGYAFDDDAFDCEFFQQVIAGRQSWIPGTALSAVWVHALIQPESWVSSDDDESL